MSYQLSASFTTQRALPLYTLRMPLVYSPPLIAGGACPPLLQDDKFHNLTEKMAASNGPADPPEEPLNVPFDNNSFHQSSILAGS